MSIQLTTEQVIQMAPDNSSASAGKKLANTKHWRNPGQNDVAMWGECQGSALYQVKVDLTTLAVQCSCPSRKQPCKHGIGLLLLAASNPTTIPMTEPPEWIVAWLQRKAASSQRKEARKAQAADPTVQPSVSQQKTAEKRLAQVTQGVERLDLWLNDLVRNGLSSLETQSAKFWENQAAQMVDAQAPGLAARLRRMTYIPNASPDWPAKLLRQLGQLALLTHAYSRLEQLDPALQEDVRLMVGWSLREEEVMARGEHVSDDWAILGQVNEESSRGISQRTWLFGTDTRRPALIEQFAPKGSAIQQFLPVGACWRADLCYWPGALPQRALIAKVHQNDESFKRLSGFAILEAFLEQVATTLARQPWRERFLCLVQDVIPLQDKASGGWFIRDHTGQSLPLIVRDHWELLALSGGRPVDFAGEWDGMALLPFGVFNEDTYYRL